MTKNNLNFRLSFYILFFLLTFSSNAFSQVADYNPKSIIAGNGSILTITGTGFGATRGANAYVAFQGFRLIKVLETDYVLWSNTQIQVKVPLGAGSGSPILVINPSLTYTLGYLEVRSLVTSDAFSPSHISAGTGSVLTITGSGFGPNKTLNNYVEFLGGNAGQSIIRTPESDYISWTDTKIELRVPSGAGDGPVYITMDNGTIKTIHPWLTIDYNINKVGGMDTKLANTNGFGGYTFHLHNNLNANNKAKEAFLSAFETWKCATGVNWVIGEPTSAKTGDNVVRILDDDETDVGAVVQTVSSYTNSGSTWLVTNVDITFSKLNHWFKFSPSEPGLYDFETVALHALGKALNLEVVNNTNDVMYWGRKVTSTPKKTLSANDLNAGNYMVNFSQTSSGFGLPMTPLAPGSCNPNYSYINSYTPTAARAGTTVTITGTNFSSITSVRFGNVAAQSFTVVSPTTINAVVASGTVSGDITVTGNGGTAAAKGFIFINKLAQTISFTPIDSKTYGDTDFMLSASASTGLSITYISSNPAVATVTNNIVHIVAAGTTIITAMQAGDATYEATTTSQTLVVSKMEQNISFPSIPSKLRSDPDFEPGAVASSGLPVSYVSSNPSVATIINSKIHLVSTGTTTITAMQSGNGNFSAAPNVMVSFMVSNLPQTMIFAEIASKKVNDIDFDPGASVNSGLPITYTSSNTSVATIVNNKIHIVGAGTTTITAMQAGNETYSAISASINLTVNKLQQTISIPQITTKIYNDPDFEINATANSGLPLTYTSSNINVATIVNNKIHIVGAGTTTITATQAGNSTYLSASTSIDLTINKLQQTINFAQISLKTHKDSDFDLNAIASSGLPVSYRSSNTAVATIVGGKVHIVAAGSAIITASQVGDANHNAAVEVTQNLDVIFNISVSNFSIKTTDETCKTSDNGSLNIITTQTLDYTATITGNNNTTTHPFNSVLSVNSLKAGTYNVCITVAGQPFYKQCFDLVIKEPKDLAVYSSLKNDGNTVVLKLEGSDLYRIDLNGQIITTTEQEITLPLIKGANLVKISSDKACQGVITKSFLTTNSISLYPNPVKNVLNITTGSTSTDAVKVEIHALDGRLMHTSQHIAEYGQVAVDLSKLNRGLYVLTLTVGKSKTVHKIIKD